MHEIFREVGNGPVNKRLNFGSDPCRDTGKTCLGGGMQCTVPLLLVLSVFDGRLTGYVLLLTYRYLHGLERPLQSSYSGRL